MDVRGLTAVVRATGRKRRPAPARRWPARVALGLAGLYLGGAALAAGLATGSRLAGLDPAVAGANLGRLPLALGVAGALWEGGCLVDPAPWRPLFVAPGTLVLAEALLALATPVKRALAALAGLFALGLAWGRPHLFLPGLAVTGLMLVWTACLERLLHVLAPAGLFRQRGFLAVCLGLAAALLGLRALAGAGAPALPPALGHLASWPGAQAVRFWQTLDPGALRVPIAATVLLLGLTGLAVRFDLGRPRRSAGALAGGRIWTVRSPRLAIARLQVHQLLSSRAGQLRLFVTLAVVALAKEPELLTVGTLRTPPGWTAGAAAFTLGCILMVPLANLFGFDRGGVRTWWAAPIADRDLLLGKTLGCAGYALLATGILLPVAVATQAWHLGRIDTPHAVTLTLVRSGTAFTPARLAGLVLLLAALFLWWAGSGLRQSVRSPFAISPGSYAAKFDFDEDKLARLGSLLAPLTWMLPVFTAAGILGPAWAGAVATLLLVGAAFRFQRRLAEATQDLADLREPFTLALG